MLIYCETRRFSSFLFMPSSYRKYITAATKIKPEQIARRKRMFELLETECCPENSWVQKVIQCSELMHYENIHACIFFPEKKKELISREKEE